MSNAKYFRKLDVQQLGETLITIADHYPLQFRTERDFYPLVLTYAQGRTPSVETEHRPKDLERIDFRFGGTNPSLLELVVTPRALKDPGAPEVRFAGHGKTTQLYASANESELKKLGEAPYAKAKARYLLLVDLCGEFKKATLSDAYKRAASKLKIANPVRVVYVRRAASFDFLLAKQSP